jgi:uncharacterized protein YndB with AHSA1/START domain
MTVVETTTDDRTMTLVAEFDADVERVWQVWADPRKLERWWGPPTWPATVDGFDFTVGGRVAYHMTGPDGTKSRGWWTITAIEPPHRLEFDDGFADEAGQPVTSIPATHAVVTLEPAGTGTRMTTVTTFAGPEHLKQLVDMGMEEGTRLAAGQIDAVLAEG